MNKADEAAPSAHLVIVFPQDKGEATSLALALHRSLSAECTEPPVPVRPDVTALCLLVNGTLSRITRAVDDVTDAYSRWLVVPVGTPHSARGLSTADLWLQRHR